MTRLLMVFLLLGAANFAAAQTTSTRSSTALLGNHLDVLDQRAAQQYNSSVRLKPTSVIIPGTPAAQMPYNGTYRGPYLALAKQAAREHRIPEDLFLRLVQQESGWNAKAVSHAGAIGLAQLMPATAKTLGVNPHNPKQNLEGGARYLAKQFRRFKTWPLALAAYNAGPGAVEKYGRIPPYTETRNYVKVIMGRR